MKLKKIYFDAFKSLLNTELEINENCIGFVGPNESGKSNVLEAVNVLGSERKLRRSDTPKMARENNPCLRFDFEFENNEKSGFHGIIQKWASEHTTVNQFNIDNIAIIQYNVVYNSATNQEERFFDISDIKIHDDCMVLRQDNISDSTYKIYYQDSFLPLSKAIIINKSDVKKNNEFLLKHGELEEINNQIVNLKNELNKSLTENPNTETEDKEVANESNENATNENVDIVKGSNPEKSIPKNNKKQKELDRLLEKKEELVSLLQIFDPLKIIDTTTKEIDIIQTKQSEIETQLEDIQNKISELQKLPDLDAAQKGELTKKSNAENLLISELNTIKLQIKEKSKIIDTLREPLESKYTNDSNELNIHLRSVVHNYLTPLLPKVVFWEHSKDFILGSDTLFSDLLKQPNLQSVSRPLVNLFRIGLNIKSMEDLKDKIKELQEDPNERSRINETLNRKINKYIKGIWIDYDQDIKITLEAERIRIEVFDPKYREHSYYNMEERSQGAQTFISFLMTIGAEAKKGVIKNTILLLDEPETHLHPSGVRFMLQELLKIADSGNIVIFATHSIFMFDRDNYDRHIILEKSKEKTIIKPSKKDKIGYFMQEEVLYNALDVKLGEDFTSTNQVNFVFEGDGDAKLFEHYYTEIINSDTRPFILKYSNYYQGGKCSDIKKYLCQRPIQLGTKWIFILDNDPPANGLIKFINGKYKDYLNKDIFAYQYSRGGTAEKCELEDLIPEKWLVDSYIDLGNKYDIQLLESDIESIISENNCFNNYNIKVLEKYFDNDIVNDLKGEFKSFLNKRIVSKLGDLNMKEKFEEELPDYYTWACKVISELKEPQKASAN